jgi:hypothetical protein
MRARDASGQQLPFMCGFFQPLDVRGGIELDLEMGEGAQSIGIGSPI